MKNINTSAFMGRGTTPCIQYNFPYAKDDVAKIYIILHGMQSGNNVEKTDSEVYFGEGFIQVTLTQEDTLGFYEDEKIMMSIKTRLTDETVPYSPPMYTYMGKVLKEEVI